MHQLHLRKLVVDTWQSLVHLACMCLDCGRKSMHRVGNERSRRNWTQAHSASSWCEVTHIRCYRSTPPLPNFWQECAKKKNIYLISQIVSLTIPVLSRSPVRLCQHFHWLDVTEKASTTLLPWLLLSSVFPWQWFSFSQDMGLLVQLTPARAAYSCVTTVVRKVAPLSPDLFTAEVSPNEMTWWISPKPWSFSWLKQWLCASVCSLSLLIDSQSLQLGLLMGITLNFSFRFPLWLRASTELETKLYWTSHTAAFKRHTLLSHSALAGILAFSSQGMKTVNAICSNVTQPWVVSSLRLHLWPSLSSYAP